MDGQSAVRVRAAGWARLPELRYDLGGLVLEEIQVKNAAQAAGLHPGQESDGLQAREMSTQVGRRADCRATGRWQQRLTVPAVLVDTRTCHGRLVTPVTRSGPRYEQARHGH